MSTYTTVSSVRTPAVGRGLRALDTRDFQVRGIKTLSVGVGLGVLQQVDDELSGLDGPAGLGDTELLA